MTQLKKETTNLLAKEAALSAMNLGVGLTFLRKYNFAQLGFIYQSFFSLSIGIERLIKLILLYEYILLNNSYPPPNFLKSKGHSIIKLFDELKPLIEKYKCQEYFDRLKTDSIYPIILNNLSDFATANRYFNLNKLSGSTITQDPVGRWNNEINSLIIERHFDLNSSKNQRVMEIAKKFSSSTIVKHTNENDNEIKDYKNLVFASLQVEVKQKYSMFYTFCIIKALCELQRSQNSLLRSNIYLDEFFMIFREKYTNAKRLKSWNPHYPYKF
ncbi:hypothetical protein [Flavobacterium sp. LB2P74]|uniref:hypothetical protein n=1 Tax=Flavobacterium sp. LB2P74 TaxID=3401717 RepID=UPI003AABB332